MGLIDQVWNRGTVCNDFAHVINTFCVPVVGACNLINNEGFLKDCGLVWCLAKKPLQGNTDYINPIPSTEKLMLQTAFLDEGSTDRMNPDAGWGDWIHIRVCDAAGNAVLDTDNGNNINTIASRWINGWNGKNSIQIVELDMTLIPVDTFTVEIFTAGGQSLCSEPFCKQDNCRNVLKVSSAHGGSDCFNQYYGTFEAFNGSGDFQFDNTIWIPANIRNSGGTNEVEQFGLSVIGAVGETSNWEVEIWEKIPPYLERYLRRVIFVGSAISVDDEVYTYAEAETTVLRRSEMFKPTFTVSRKCVVEHGGC